MALFVNMFDRLKNVNKQKQGNKATGRELTINSQILPQLKVTFNR